MRSSAAAMSMPSPRTGVSGSAIFSKRAAIVFRLKRAGSRRGVTSRHSSGHEAGAPGSGRSENGATMVCPCPFCPKSM
jgi:hypothetical protein